MESEHFVGKVAQKAIIEREGEILVCKGIGDTVWEFPGGRLHDAEEPTEGLIREIKEELGITVQVMKPIFITRSFHGKNKVWQIFIAYHCVVAGEIDIKADKREVEDLKWVPRDKIMSLPMFDDCYGALRAYLAQK